MMMIMVMKVVFDDNDDAGAEVLQILSKMIKISIINDTFEQIEQKINNEKFLTRQKKMINDMQGISKEDQILLLKQSSIIANYCPNSTQ